MQFGRFLRRSACVAASCLCVFVCKMVVGRISRGPFRPSLGRVGCRKIINFRKYSKYEENLINNGVSLDSEEYQLQSSILKKFMEEDSGKHSPAIP